MRTDSILLLAKMTHRFDFEQPQADIAKPLARVKPPLLAFEGTKTVASLSLFVFESRGHLGGFAEKQQPACIFSGPFPSCP